MRSEIFLTEESIKNRCRAQATYNQGLADFRKGSVQEIRKLQGGRIYECMVREQNKVFKQGFEFNKHGILERTKCDCEEFSQTPGHCRHAVAALLAIREQILSGDRGDTDSQAAIDQIMENWQHFQQIGTAPTRKYLRVEWTFIYERSPYRQGRQYYISMKIGDERTYIVPAIDVLLDAIRDEQVLTFTSKFSYLPNEHTFHGKDLQVIQILQEIRELSRLVGESSNPHGRSIFRDKKVALTPAFAMRFLKTMQGEFISVELPDRKLDKVPVFAADLPIQFTLSKQENLELWAEYYGNILSLFDTNECFIYNDMIYLVTEYQQSVIKSLQLVFGKNRTRSIIVPQEHQEQFVSNMLHFVAKKSKVRIEDRLQEQLNQQPLIVKAYLDYHERTLYCELQFHYGEIAINPYEEAVSNPYQAENVTQSENSVITVRDLQRERHICQLFDEWQFQHVDAQMCLSDEQQLFTFIVEKMPILHEHAQVYCTDAFQVIEKTKSPKVRGKFHVNKSMNMFEVSFDTSGIAAEDLAGVLSAIQQKKRFYRLQDGAFISLLTGENGDLERIAHVIDMLHLDKRELMQGSVQLPLYKALLVDDVDQESLHDVFERDEQFLQFVKEIRNHSDMEYPVPETIGSVLRPYQATGYQWFRTLEYFGFGGVLADDMGLGKTIQAISFIVSLKLRDAEPALVIAPTSLVYNWQNEFAAFAPDLDVLVVSGNQYERQLQLEDIQSADVIVTSYPLVRRDIEQYTRMHFSVCILDEAQFLKNPVTQTAQSVKMLQAKSFFALTGTPIENSLSDLWSIFDCVLPGYFPPLQQFQRIYEQDNLKDLHGRISPFVLRRLKKDVLQELPEKIENRYISALTHEQKKIYLAYLEQIKGNVGEILKQGTFAKSKIRILAALTRLRQICCHPGLFVEGYTGESGKLLQLIEIVEESLAGGHRLLIFSQFSSMLKIIRTVMEEHQVSYFYLDGSTPALERMDMANQFNQGDKDVFLISLKAGGTGLNLTGADTVVLYDLWWNPAVEDQAADRAHRIGQQKVVQVIRMIAQGTIEEKIYELQQQKRHLVDQVIRSGETLLTKLTEAEIRDLLDMQTSTM